MVAGGLPADVIYRQCPECFASFKRGNALRMAESTPVDVDAPEVRMLDTVAFRELIDAHVAEGNRQEEKTARMGMKYWFHLNDGLRTGHPRQPQRNRRKQRNADQNDDFSLTMRFDEARASLSKASQPSGGRPRSSILRNTL